MHSLPKWLWMGYGRERVSKHTHFTKRRITDTQRRARRAMERNSRRANRARA